MRRDRLSGASTFTKRMFCHFFDNFVLTQESFQVAVFLSWSSSVHTMPRNRHSGPQGAAYDACSCRFITCHGQIRSKDLWSAFQISSTNVG
jgi:hypothetical protein